MLRIGSILYGFCGGHFGRDSYEDKRIEAIGTDWIVARDKNGLPLFADFIEGWKVDDLEKYTIPEEET